MYIILLTISFWDITREPFFVNYLCFEDFLKSNIFLRYLISKYQICLKEKDWIELIICKFLIAILQTILGEILAINTRPCATRLLSLGIFITLPNLPGPHYWNVSRILLSPGKYFMSTDWKKSNTLEYIFIEILTIIFKGTLIQVWKSSCIFVLI